MSTFNKPHRIPDQDTDDNFDAIFAVARLLRDRIGLGGLVDLVTGVTNRLRFVNFTQATAASRLLGRGSAAGPGDFEEISLGTGLAMSGTTLSATAGATRWEPLTDGDVDETELIFAGGECVMVEVPL